jgi:hypothetical protein
MSADFERIPEVCARVAALARFVRIDEAGFEDWVDRLESGSPEGASDATPDPAHHFAGEPDTTLAFVVTLDAINFGSGWFPELTKRDGMSGYFTIATHLAEHFARHGPWSAVALRRFDADQCADVFGQRGNVGAYELMALFARALRDLGSWLGARHGGSFTKAIESASGSASRLVALLCEMPLYRDVASYAGFEVPFYKRAQITVSDLDAALDGEGLGRFDGLERLTIFADNLVPHVLRCDGVLHYDPELVSRIERHVLLAPGSPEEVEIRAVALHAVERAVAALRERGVEASARRLDTQLWRRGQRPEIKAHPRHRARCAYY